MGHHVFQALLILFCQQTNCEDNVLALVVDAAKHNQGLVESGLYEAPIYEYNVSVIEIVFYHVMASEKHVIIPTRLLYLFLDMKVTSLGLIQFVLLDLTKLAY